MKTKDSELHRHTLLFGIHHFGIKCCKASLAAFHN